LDNEHTPVKQIRAIKQVAIKNIKGKMRAVTTDSDRDRRPGGPARIMSRLQESQKMQQVQPRMMAGNLAHIDDPRSSDHSGSDETDHLLDNSSLPTSADEDDEVHDFTMIGGPIGDIAEVEDDPLADESDSPCPPIPIQTATVRHKPEPTIWTTVTRSVRAGHSQPLAVY